MIGADDHVLAAHVAQQAGELLNAIRQSLGRCDAAAVRAAGDSESNELILGLLREARPSDVVLSEESIDDHRRLSSRRVWIVDPLDGTREFGEVGRTDWAVQVVLWEAGELVAGAVAMPAIGRIWTTAHPPLLTLRSSPASPLRLAVSRTRPPEFMTDLCAVLGARAVPMGSAGAKAMAVLTGDVDAYVHAGGLYEWDSAAPVAVARAAGLHATRLDGAQLRYNQRDPLLPDLVVCRADIAAPLMQALKGVVAADR